MQDQIVTYKGQPYRVLQLVRLANQPWQVWLAAEGHDLMVLVCCADCQGLATAP